MIYTVRHPLFKKSESRMNSVAHNTPPIAEVFNDFYITKQHPLLVKYVDDLQRKNAEALSFYPRCVFEREQQNGRIFLAMLHNQPCGYIYVGANGPDLKCHQVCIQYDARRRLYGAALVAAMEDQATALGVFSISLRCGFDLDANDFWKSLGYVCTGIQNGGIRRMRRINCWRKQIHPELFDIQCVEPESGKTNAKVWSKNKQTGLVTQFVRGKRLQDYRAKIISASESIIKPKTHY